MRKRRVLIVDDSVVVRRTLTDALSREAGLEAAGSASSGRTALMKIPLLRPDAVLLDIDMPGMDGVETLTAIRRSYPGLPVIMLNVPDGGGAAVMHALALGANDVIMKPSVVAPSAEALRVLGGELAAKVESCCATPGESLEREAALPSVPVERDVDSRVDVLAIGVSTGGPGALMELIPRFPKDFPIPILIVQHMPPTFTKLLAERLAAKSSLRIAEGALNDVVQPGTAWIAPGGFHMAVCREREVVRLALHQGPPENSCRPAADVLFRSVAAVYGRNVLALVMTGMGQDGLRGCEHIRAAGGQVLVQDETTSVVWGMPGFVVRAGMADGILPLDELGPEILARVWKHRRRPLVALGGD